MIAMYGNYSNLYEDWCQCYDPTNVELRILNKYINFEGKKILEIGCGTGRFTRRIASKAKVIKAIDNDELTIKWAQENMPLPNTEYVCCDALSITDCFCGEQFDLIVYSWSINYIDDIRKSFQSALELLEDGGQIVVMYTSLGEYELLMRAVLYDSRITDEGYEMTKNIFAEEAQLYCEDVVVTDFVFPDLNTAVQRITFFFDVDGCALMPDQEMFLRKELAKRTRRNDSISISDTVKILIGGKKDV